MIDIDFFKKINDTYGHSFGDTALKETADCIRHSVRSSDVVIRYGGEEFLVFLPDTGSAEAADLAERIRTEVGEHGMKATGKDGSETIFKATVSIGIAGTDQLKEWRKTTQEKIHGQEDVGTHFKDTVTKCADTALYDAKKGGRNNVTVWEGDMKKEQ
jgi:diguanylate cyclase